MSPGVRGQNYGALSAPLVFQLHRVILTRAVGLAPAYARVLRADEGRRAEHIERIEIAGQVDIFVCENAVRLISYVSGFEEIVAYPLLHGHIPLLHHGVL